ncbi:hypothetical protein PMIN02_009580 [Paraphaeosphaeria minitans]|uniref:WD repeat-containing protein n=1 Tax=Paraphaeosphaeria minitans TaxID=565426 RepID=A0A9P6KM54_9PLEO|nr:WD repeat-containing protein [Paraphaeosphaeria minitans]
MSQSNDPGHFFQTDAWHAETARRAAKSKNDKGNPVKLPSKILAITADPHDHALVYVAEAAGSVKRINPEAEEKKVVATYTGPEAPLTSLAISHKSGKLFAGCWDKTIWSWDVKSRRPGQRFRGHVDFVKTVLVFTLQGKELLLSGSQDATIIVWDAATGQRLYTMKGHTRGILALALDPLDYEPSNEEAIVFSAGSDREIRRWRVGTSAGKEIKEEPCPILAHETSVDLIHFDSDGDLWTASADKTAKCLSRARNWKEDSSFEHPDYTRDVVVDEEGGWVVTACRDENVRVLEKGSGKLHHVFEGHFEEVTALVLLEGQKVISVSIDGSVRTWSLKVQDLAKAIKEAEDEKEGKVEEKVEEKKEGLMTLEEEEELAALLGDSD